MNNNFVTVCFLSFFTFLLPITYSSSIAAGSGPNLVQSARKSVVYISFDVTDPQTGAVSKVQGTGFVVSRDGLIVTASHLFRDWHKQLDIDKQKNKILGTIGGRPGEVGHSPLHLRPVNIGNPEFVDVASLLLPSTSGVQFGVAKICFKKAHDSNIGDRILGLGFPQNQGFQPVSGDLGNKNGPRGRWAGSIAFTYGMSGGPVYNTEGYVIALIQGGLDRTIAVRWMTPIIFAKSFIETSNFKENCPIL